MQLTVKALKGKEAHIQVSEGDTVLAVKRLVEEKLQVPVSQQRLLFRGKSLADEHCLSHYSIGPGSRLNLMVKDQVAPEGHSGNNTAWKSLSVILRKHFSPADAERVLEYVQKDYERSLSLLSLDDIERLATRILHPQYSEAADLGFLD
ncbi:ubiquitin-like protein 4A [Xenopus laevis]|uniref:Ubiquitin-like protein 4A n=3 Tax=Xenopus laevis TaxID=8355 RepID=UBL4A_XENLA|nr:ubiquitin-like protein 4A [Xenopus laevis]Q0D261.1 RecName: Full=Ubiquitin-like protein 4A [Xenopus laevis]AAI22491.1 Unknown (protein for MGC:154224) [Xenopus laevis]